MSLQREILSPVTTAGLLLESRDNPSPAKPGVTYPGSTKGQNSSVCSVDIAMPKGCKGNEEYKRVCCGQIFTNPKKYSGHRSWYHSNNRVALPKQYCLICQKEIPPQERGRGRKFCCFNHYKEAVKQGLIKPKWNRVQRSKLAKNQWKKLKNIMGSHISIGKKKKILENPEYYSNIGRRNGLKAKKRHCYTSIEIKLFNALEFVGVKCLPQIIIPNVCVVDIVPDKSKMAIFCDGDYWHNYPEGTEKDRRVNKKLEELGWIVLRFWEHEINKNINSCISKILQTLSLGYHGGQVIFPTVRSDCVQTSVCQKHRWDSSITFPKQSGSPGAVVDEVAEGAGNSSN
jgi:very-short-patch-repair endonuclease